jgi:hypothetical protein
MATIECILLSKPGNNKNQINYTKETKYNTNLNNACQTKD